MAASVWTLCKNLLLSDAVFLSQRILNISAFFLDKSKTFLDPFGIAYFNFWQRSFHRTKLQYEPTTVVEIVKRSCGIAMGNSNWSAFSGGKDYDRFIFHNCPLWQFFPPKENFATKDYSLRVAGCLLLLLRICAFNWTFNFGGKGNYFPFQGPWTKTEFW